MDLGVIAMKWNSTLLSDLKLESNDQIQFYVLRKSQLKGALTPLWEIQQVYSKSHSPFGDIKNGYVKVVQRAYKTIEYILIQNCNY